jgi:small conductance mechanosensitive channel
MDWILQNISADQLTTLVTTYGGMLLKAVLTLVVGWWIAASAQGVATRALESAHVDHALAKFLGNIVRYVIIAAVILAAAQSFGFEITSLMAIFASAGLAVGLALQGSLSHFAAGVMILFFRPFTINDWVTIGGETGMVMEIGLFATTLRKVDGTKLTVPNGAITGTTILNHTALGVRRGTVDIGVAYGSDLDKARAALQRAVQAAPDALTDPEPVVYFAGFGASSLDFQVHVYAEPDKFLSSLEQARVNIYAELAKDGIEIPFSQMDIHFRNALPSA